MKLLFNCRLRRNSIMDLKLAVLMLTIKKIRKAKKMIQERRAV